MGRINVLDKSISELIAAGEVVERPSSVIKELVENSIDAGSTSITVEVKNGGIRYMRIADNGCGIMREDVPLAFLRHATSKVRIQNDLDCIATLGFRGEALASVCAVARVELLTCTADETIGTSYTINGSNEGSLQDAGCPVGTTIIVRDLFYNIPARMKFLKKDVSEGNAVANVMDKIALSHPEISFAFIRDGKQTLKTPGDGKLMSAIYSVYGRDFAQGLIPVDYSLNGVTVNGYISKPAKARPNRNMQNFFINGRFVKSRTAMAALEQACKGSVMVGKFPSCVLNIAISCEAVDVNVHPAKIEVRFINERPVFDAVYHGAKTALLQGDTVKEVSLDVKNILNVKQANPFSLEENLYAVKPEKLQQLDLRTTIKKQNEILEAESSKNDLIPKQEPQLYIPRSTQYNECDTVADIGKSINSLKTVENELNEAFKIKTIDILQEGNFVKDDNKKCIDDTINEKTSLNANDSHISGSGAKPFLSGDFVEPVETGDSENSTFIEKSTPSEASEICPLVNDSLKADEKPQYKYIGEAFNTYIIVERDDNQLVLIDKHAAHERILFEKIKAEKGNGSMQYLLSPVSVNLPKLDYDAVINNNKVLSQLGFEVEDFGNGTVLIRGVPQYIDHTNIKAAVEEIAGYLCDHKVDINTDSMDWIYHSMACRAAIKAGNINHEQELVQLVEILDNDDTIRYCPHGRPVSVVLTKRELEKQFGRV